MTMNRIGNPRARSNALILLLLLEVRFVDSTFIRFYPCNKYEHNSQCNFAVLLSVELCTVQQPPKEMITIIIYF